MEFLLVALLTIPGLESKSLTTVTYPSAAVCEDAKSQILENMPKGITGIITCLPTKEL